MNAHDILNYYRGFTGLDKILQSGENRFAFSGGLGAIIPILVATGFEINKSTVLIVLPEEENALQFQSDLRNLLPEQTILFFPSSLKKDYAGFSSDNSNKVLRIETLNQLVKNKAVIVVATANGFAEKVVTQPNFEKNTFNIIKDQILNMDTLFDFLEINGFERTDFVYEPGEFAIRGGIIDIFPFNTELPFRINMDDDRIAGLKIFEIDTQISKTEIDKISIIPDLNSEANVFSSLLAYLPKSTCVVLNQASYLTELSAQKGLNDDKKEIIHFSTTEELIRGLQDFTIVEYGGSPLFTNHKIIELKTEEPPKFSKDLSLINDYLFKLYSEGYQFIFCADNQKQYNRFLKIVNENQPEISLSFFLGSLSKGFTDHQQKLCFLTDHEVFSRYHKPTMPTIRKQQSEHQLQDLKALKPGDYLVHIDYGIGRFAGLEKVDNNGNIQEAIKILYEGNDVLYVGIHSLYKVSKYRGSEGAPPKMHKLGSKIWVHLKEKTKRKVKDIAKDLIKLYAKRKKTKGFLFSSDTIWQQELEASFFFEDTPDQEKSIEAVKTDMESNLAMDRLICGDVGFGKTEVAIRAAFKAVVDGKQVAVLVPTTILALQHFKTFSMRLKDLPCTVDYISRFKSTKQQKDTLKQLKEGKIDIIIGTHRLVSKDVQFKDLGFLIIDEEQKFGVGLKEKLRQIKPNVDTLTLTATPIPRTLQFSLMGARDISIINTPPPNRLPIYTEIQPLNMDLIRKAILFEINRNGQVFFINNRIQNIFEIQELLAKHIPEAKTIVAHGQMESANLERIMYNFIDGEYDVLISTSIIESGLDIPNANTIIINNAHHFGLSDLHQLRGRVGRTNIKAFCYLITPPLNTLPDDTRRKLTALVEFSELGSGFNIALQDLEIRGAGNLLGAEQSGFINEIGMETYQKILDEALIELKIEDSQIAEEIANQQEEKEKYWVRDCIIDTDFQIMFPDEYVNNSTERLKLYKELNNLTNEEELFHFHEQLVDRFGKLPRESEDLLTLVKIRWVAMSLGISKVFLKNSILRATFTQEPAFFQSEVFGNLLRRLSKIKGVRLAEKNERALLIKEDIKNIHEILKIFRLLLVSDVADDG